MSEEKTYISINRCHFDKELKNGDTVISIDVDSKQEGAMERNGERVQVIHERSIKHYMTWREAVDLYKELADLLQEIQKGE